MHPRAGVPRQQGVARDDRLLGCPRPARQTEPGRIGALVRDGADREPRLLGVLGDQHAQAARVLKRAPHDQRIVDADAVVGEHPHLTDPCGHHSHLGELGACQSDGHRPDRMHVDQSDLLPAVPDVIGDHRTVGDGVRVRHREHRGVATECRCCRTGFDVLGVLATRLAEMGVQVDETGQQYVPARVDDFGVLGRLEFRSDFGESARRRRARRPGLPRRTAGLRGARLESCADRLPFGSDQQVEQHRHPHVDSVGNLLQHGRLR